jgi:hypothetical protein
MTRFLTLFAAVVMSACSGGGPTAPTGSSNQSGLTFTTPNLGGVSAGQVNSGYSFCRPPISGNDLCDATATNPTGGQPPYHFELGTGGGFPPIGMRLNLNGTLTGTPTVAGVSNFVVCAVDLAGRSACDTVRFTVDAAGTTTPPPSSGSGSSSFDGTYDFRFAYPTGPGTNQAFTPWARIFRVTNGILTTTDGLLRGTVDSSGRVVATSVCPQNESLRANWQGTLRLGGTSGKFGDGTYACVGLRSYDWFVDGGR